MQPDPLDNPDPLPGPPGGVNRARQRVIAVAEIVICSSVPTQIAIGYLLTLAGLAPMTPDERLSLPFVLTLSLVDTGVLIVLMVALTRAHGQSVAALWLGERPVGREVLFGLTLIPLVFLLVVVLLNVLRLVAPWLHTVPENPLEQLAATGATQAALLGLVAIIAGGVREELMRAFLLQRFEQHLGGATVGVIVLSVAFGLAHSVQGWDAMITTGVLGAFWAVVYLRRRSSVAPVVSHAGFNSLEILRVALVGAGAGGA